MAIKVLEAADARAIPAREEQGIELGAYLRGLDWVLLSAVGLLVAYGLWAIAGITQHDVPGNTHYYVVRQGVYAGIGGLGLLGLVFIDPEYYRRYKRGIYGGTLALMLFVLAAGTVTRGSKRWLDLGFFRFQPSEFGKLLFVLFLAGYLADRARKVSQPKTVLATIGFAAGPVVLVFLQPDVGTALVYSIALAGVLFVAGTRWTHLALLGTGAAVLAVLVLWALPAAGVNVLKPYQVQRLTSFTHPNSDPQSATYNVEQSKNAVGAGGFRGRGVAGATQTNLNFLPEHATDFVFASLAEERGFVGVSVLLLLYLLIVWRGLKVVAIARDPFSAIAAGGIVVAFLFQIFVNVGMTIGIAPITGIPLPLVSVGGSSMVANLLAIGVLEAIYVRGSGGRRRRVLR
ncbi:MAG: rod shape-determining protein RodA [Gaiellaceae bacterium]